MTLTSDQGGGTLVKRDTLVRLIHSPEDKDKGLCAVMWTWTLVVLFGLEEPQRELVCMCCYCIVLCEHLSSSLSVKTKKK